jgi:phosphomevalonate kinase
MKNKIYYCVLKHLVWQVNHPPCLCSRLGTDTATLIKISAPIKSHWAEKHGLNFEELMSAGEYKEAHRQDMINWSEEIRQKDYGYFCQAAVEMFNGMYTMHLLA